MLVVEPRLDAMTCSDEQAVVGQEAGALGHILECNGINDDALSLTIDDGVDLEVNRVGGDVIDG